MAKKFGVAIDLQKNELQNARVHNLSGAPSSPVSGQIYYDTVANKAFYYNGSSWIDMTGGAVSFGTVDTGATFGQAAVDGVSGLASHTDHRHPLPAHGGAAHSGVSHSDLAVPSGPVAWNNQKITGLADPTTAQDAATKAYVDAVKQGLDPKDSVRVATTAALAANGYAGGVITASANGVLAAIDGVSLIVGDSVLVKNEGTGLKNGIYVVTSVGAVGAPWVLTRRGDSDVNIEVTSGLFTFVEEGTTNGDSGWVLTTNNPITVGTTTLTFVQFSGAGQITAGTGITKTGNTLAIDRTRVPFLFAGTFGDNAASSFNIDHNLNTLDVLVQVYEVATGIEIECDVTRSTVNRVVLAFSIVPTLNQYRVVVHG